MKTINDIETIIQENQAVMLYFSAPTCNVCHALKPKLFEAMESNFEVFEKVSIDISEAQDVAAHFGVFTIPTIIVFLEGKEFFKKSRNMSIDEVVKEIKRPYEMMLS
ncbi:MAG: thioredoxin family protein [Sulfurimonadaceae bacterium]|jgi:thioredoxin-like negative regulator of GroEL|nr:thioredoxin family protein [Sulfurimonadaceae bacterium]